MENNHPLILITNDDGIQSPGLWAAARAVRGLGTPFIVAPCRQWSGASRCFPADSSGSVHLHALEIDGHSLEAYCVDASPAQVVLRAAFELVPRPPALLVVGVNYGENLGADSTISGTVGAALQGATMGIPALAVSLQTPKETHTNPTDNVDFASAIHFTRLFARRLLEIILPFDADVIKIDVPDDATPQTSWRLTRVSRQTYFRAIRPNHDDPAQPVQVDYEARWDLQTLEPDSDIYAFAVDRVVAVSPLSIDLTSRASSGEMEAVLRGATEL